MSLIRALTDSAGRFAVQHTLESQRFARSIKMSSLEPVCREQCSGHEIMQLLERWRSQLGRRQSAQYLSAAHCCRVNNWLGIPVIVWTAVVGSTVFAAFERHIWGRPVVKDRIGLPRCESSSPGFVADLSGIFRAIGKAFDGKPSTQPPQTRGGVVAGIPKIPDLAGRIRLSEERNPVK